MLLVWRRFKYASIFTALGVRVTIVGAGDHLPPALDGEMARVLVESFKEVSSAFLPSKKAWWTHKLMVML